MATKKAKPPVEDTSQKEEKKPTAYVVTDCARLNVREKPNIKAKVSFIISRGTRVEVDHSEEHEAWYKVIVNKYGIGYAMKNYLTPIQ